MIHLLDTSAVVAAIVLDEPHHAACAAVLMRPGAAIYSRGLAETYAYLTGGRLEPRVPPEAAAQAIEESVLAFAQAVHLTTHEITRAFGECQARGIRGGAVYDYLHLVAARKVRARCIYTLNVRHFRAFHRSGDPETVRP